MLSTANPGWMFVPVDQVSPDLCGGRAIDMTH